MDFLQGLDPSKLVLFGTTLSFVISPFTVPSYNLPIFLFGTYAQDNAEAVTSAQTFTALVGGSILWDIVWMSRNDQNGFIKFLGIILIIAKIPTFFAFAVAVRQRGVQISGLNAIRDFSGTTVWSMPGGFTSTGREGYQNMDEEAGFPPAQPPPAHQPPHTVHAPQPKAPPPAPPYQTA